jgi:glycosyltransferase involved in cell wall biosynthesis
MPNPNEQENQLLISIVVPVKNAEENSANIRKMLNQVEFNPVEIILVHDIFAENPSPRLQDIVDSFPNTNVKLITVKAGDPGSARNSGLKLIQGMWVSFWDADDEPNLENLISIVRSAQQSGSDVCIGSFQIRERDIVSDRELNFKKGLKQILDNPGIWRFSFRSNLLTNVEFPALRMGEDQIFLLRMQLPNKKIYLSKISVYTYIRGSKLQATNTNSSRKEIIKSLKLSLQFYSSQPGPTSDFDRAVISRIALTTLKVYGSSIINLDSLKRIFLDLGFSKFALFTLSLLRVTLSLIYTRAMSWMRLG